MITNHPKPEKEYWIADQLQEDITHPLRYREFIIHAFSYLLILTLRTSRPVFYFSSEQVHQRSYSKYVFTQTYGRIKANDTNNVSNINQYNVLQ